MGEEIPQGGGPAGCLRGCSRAGMTYSWEDGYLDVVNPDVSLLMSDCPAELSMQVSSHFDRILFFETECNERS